MLYFSWGEKTIFYWVNENKLPFCFVASFGNCFLAGIENKSSSESESNKTDVLAFSAVFSDLTIFVSDFSNPESCAPSPCVIAVVSTGLFSCFLKEYVMK